MRLFESTWIKAEVENGLNPRISEITYETMTRYLREYIPVYKEAEIEAISVDIAEVKPLCLSIERFKLFRLYQLAILREKHNVPSAAVFHGSSWPIIPPIVEETKEHGLVIIDGTHRIFSALSRGLTTVEVLLIKNVAAPLPATPLSSWDEVQLVLGKRPREQR